MSRRRARTDMTGESVLLRHALREDKVDRDRTSIATLPARLQSVGRVVAQGSGVLSGVEVAVSLARRRGLRAARKRRDGDRVRPGTVVLELQGNARTMLGVERTLLNFVMHLSGVATATRRAVDASGELEVLATRKTTPGLRDLEKAAVVHGGGHPHRRDLADAILVKSTHLDLGGPYALRAIRRLTAREVVAVEVRSLAEARDAVRAGSQHLLLDNLSVAAARAIVQGLERDGVRRGVRIELTGGITPANLRAYRTVGADAVSLGSLTHSAPAVPFHLVVRAR